MSDVASNRTAHSGHELSNPSSSTSFNSIHTQRGRVTYESPSSGRKISGAVAKSPIARGDTGIRVIARSANQGFIAFQTRAIFIFEQSQVGRARSVPGSSSSSLCAIRATVIGTRSTPDWFGLLRLSPFPSRSRTRALFLSLAPSRFPFPLFAPLLHSLGVAPSPFAGLRLTTRYSGIPAETDVARGHVSP